MQPQAQHGWSLADVAVGVGVGQVIAEMSRHSDAPVLYLGHPVVAVPPEGLQAAHGPGTAATTSGAIRTTYRLLNALADVRTKMHSSHCRATWVSSNAGCCTASGPYALTSECGCCFEVLLLLLLLPNPRPDIMMAVLRSSDHVL